MSKLEKIAELIQSEVEHLTQPNRKQLIEQFTEFKKLYDQALATDLSSYQPDPTIYRGDHVSDYGQDFLS